MVTEPQSLKNPAVRSSLYRGYLGLYRGYIGLYRGYIGIMEKKMETTKMGLGLRVL